MPKAKSISFSKAKDLAHEHLEATLGELEDFEVTFAKLEEGEWRVNVEFVEEGGDEDRPETALFALDAETGEVTEFQRGYTWRD